MAMCCRALSCNTLPMFKLFSSLRCALWVPSVLPFTSSLMYLTNGSTYEAVCQAVYSRPILHPSCFAQMLCSAHCCNSLPDVSCDFFNT